MNALYSVLTDLVMVQTELGSGLGGGGGLADGGAPGPVSPGAPAAQEAAQGSPWEGLGFIFFMILIFYFLLIRPQQKRADKHKKLVGALKEGDRVITNGGIFGTIAKLDERTVTVEIAKGTKISMLRSYVGGLATEDTEKEMARGPAM